jgi:RHS repeat-associated protein
VHYVLADQQGSVASFNSASGTTELKESFGAYGSPRDPTTWSGVMSTADQTTQNAISLHGYTFHTMLAASGLIHMNGRVQDAFTGRILSADPYTSEPGNTQGYNRYAYAMNNPMTFTDPSGFCVIYDKNTGTTVTCDNLPEFCVGCDSSLYYWSRILNTGAPYGGGTIPGFTLESWEDGLDALSKSSDTAFAVKFLTGKEQSDSDDSGECNPDCPEVGVTGRQWIARMSQWEPDQNRINMCYAQADSFGNKTGTVAGFTVAGAQGGPEGALLGLGVGLAVAGLEDYLSGPGPQAIADGAGSTVLDGPSGFIGSQYGTMVHSLFPDKPGLAYPLGGAAGNTIAHIVRNRALTGAARAARWGAGAGLAYLAGYAGGFSLIYNNCLSN